jgi:hypothetical protein
MLFAIKTANIIIPDKQKIAKKVILPGKVFYKNLAAYTLDMPHKKRPEIIPSLSLFNLF